MTFVRYLFVLQTFQFVTKYTKKHEIDGYRHILCNTASPITRLAVFFVETQNLASH